MTFLLFSRLAKQQKVISSYIDIISLVQCRVLFSPGKRDFSWAVQDSALNKILDEFKRFSTNSASN